MSIYFVIARVSKRMGTKMEENRGKWLSVVINGRTRKTLFRLINTTLLLIVCYE